MHNVIDGVVTASVNISLIQRKVSRRDINCPGDVFTYRCSIQSNSENVRLTWHVTTPQYGFVDITYDKEATINQLDILNSFVSTNLTEFISDQYIESILHLTVVVDIPINQTELECLIGNIGIDTVYVPVNISGNNTSMLETTTS